MRSAKQFMLGLSVNLYKGANGKNVVPLRRFECGSMRAATQKKALDFGQGNTVPLWTEFYTFFTHQPIVNKVE